MAISGPVSVKKNASSARRCLFGPPDHERMRKDLDRALSEMDRSTKASLKSKWGFDVDSETGVPEGRYEYTEVGRMEYVPECYRKGYSSRTKRARDSVEMVSASTQMDLTTPSVSTVSSTTHTGHGLVTSISPAASRTIISGVRKLDFKENCVNSGSTTTMSTRSRNSRSSSLASPMLQQSTMTDHFQPRKRRSPDVETSLPRGKSPRL